MVLGANFGPNKIQCCEKTKKLALPMGFFCLLYEEYILKQEAVVTEIPDWKLKAKIARNTTFEEN